MNPDLFDLPDPDDMRDEDINEPHMGGFDPEKGDKDGDVSQEELDNIDRFLRDFDNKNYPPNGPEDFIF